MILNLIIAILSVFVIAGYLIALSGRPYIFIIFFPFLAIAALILGFVLVFVITKTIFWKLLRLVAKRDFTKDDNIRVTANVLIGFTLFVISVAFVIVASVKLQTGKVGQGAANPSLQAIKTLPYLAWRPAEKTINKRGVTKYDTQKAFRGINVCASVGASGVHLMDMKGKVLHTWNANNMNDTWHAMVRLCPNGDLLAVVESRNLVRLDWDSNVKWVNRMRFHHEITLAANGDIYAMARKDEIRFFRGFPVPVLNDYIVIMSPDGIVKREISLFEAAKEYITSDKVLKLYRWITKPHNKRRLFQLKKHRGYIFDVGSIFDVFHANTITIMDREIKGLGGKGDLLICIRELDLIGVLDFETGEFIWTWGPGELSRPHHPTFLENGNILVFDNGRIREYSRVIELEPMSGKIVWEYKASPEKTFYSQIMGACQRLPNGNTLITESDKSRVFEVAPNGEVVWEFYNPYIDLNKKRRAVIYRMARITDPENYPCLKGLY
jgi:hypothetical protein